MIIEKLKNYIIRKLIKTTHLHSGTIYTMLLKIPKDELDFMIKNLKNF